MYDSTVDVLKHRELVNKYMLQVVQELTKRIVASHDASKLSPEEKPLFDELTPCLVDTKYDSPEYREHLARLGPALAHHYARNRHHPEHYPNGIQGMDIIDLIEMICDWKASAYRQCDGNLLTSIDKNANKLQHSEQLKSILQNTAKLFDQ